MIYAFVYLVMSIFDLVILTGSAWLIGWHGWSAWWMLFAAYVISGRNPTKVINAIKGAEEVL